MELIAKYLNPQVRQWLYVVLTAAVPLLIAYGIVDTVQAALWLALGAAVLGTGTAAVAVRRQRKDGTLSTPAKATPRKRAPRKARKKAPTTADLKQTDTAHGGE